MQHELVSMLGRVLREYIPGSLPDINTLSHVVKVTSPLCLGVLGEVTRVTAPNFSDEGQGHTTRIFEG